MAWTGGTDGPNFNPLGAVVLEINQTDLGQGMRN